jgi:molecular chaperone GrpE
MPHSIEDEAVATEAVDVGTLLAENASLRDRLLRALADAENARRRADRAAEDARKFAIADFARELLIVVDNLERTIEAAEGQPSASAENAAIVEGIRATLRILQQTLQRFGVRRIEALGQPFDPNLHEAIMHVDDPSQPPGTVTRVVEQGYTINDRLLRPARVVVAKEPRRAGTEPDNEPLQGELQSRSWEHNR